MTESLGAPKNITMHWTAGSYDQTFDDYHWCVTGSGGVVQTLSMGVKGAHTWHRNTGNIGISLCCCPSDHPALTVQLEHAAKLIAELCHRYGIDPRATIVLPAYRREGTPDGPDDALVATGGSITAPIVTDHAFFAHHDGYFPERWDIGSLLDPLVGKARWYFDALLAGTARPEFTVHVS